MLYCNKCGLLVDLLYYNNPKMTKSDPYTLGFAAHDHANCIQSALASAQDHCARNGLQLTSARRRVLEILLREHRAMGAYDILEVLRQDGGSAQPPTAYRALDFLVAHGFVHRIEKLNAFVACAHPDTAHKPAFLICRKCDAVAEAPGTLERSALESSARSSGFEIEAAVMEAEGVCPNCQDTPAS